VTDPEITLATPADRARVVETFVAAFVADPAVRHFLPEDATYPAHAATFAGHLFDKRVGAGGVWLADGGGATALWDKPDTGPAESTMDLPADVLARLDEYDTAVHDLLPTTPHWYLGVLATHPAHAGRRLGRAVMAAGVGQARAMGLPAYLETSNPGNVEVYRGAGWRVAAETSTVELRVWVLTIE
jgi:GNAT superfamily N-acetyltransferase